jgi:hypothetical protein
LRRSYSDWAGEPEQALLLDAGRLGVALRDDEAAERVAVLARDLLPHGLTNSSPKPMVRSATGSVRKMPQR